MIAGWREHSLSYGGKSTLLKLCISSIPIIKFPKRAIEAIKSPLSHSFGCNETEKLRYHLARLA